MREDSPTDRELLLILRRDVEQLTSQLTEALGQLKRGNERFEAIALTEQELKIGMSALRSDFSRAMLAADEAKRACAEVRREVELWRARVKTVFWIGAPLVGIVAALAVEALKRLLFP